MRMFKPTFALATLGTTLLAASCTLITDVDRTKIPTDAGAGTSGSGGSGAGGGSAGSSGSGSGGDAGDGSGGTPEGGNDSGGSSGKGSGGSGGRAGEGGEAGEAGSSGSGGSGGAPVSCEKATGSISLIPTAVTPITYIADGDTFTLRDGVNDPVVFEFDLASAPGVGADHVAIPFTGVEDEAAFATLIADAINDQLTTLGITATFEGGESGGGEAGAGGESGGGEAGAGGSGGAGTGGNGGSGGSAGFGPGAVIALVNDAYGSLGNQEIDDRVGNPNFKNQDMAGGESVSCDLTPTLCNGDEDCATSCNATISLCE
jgi:hypothetical protein